MATIDPNMTLEESAEKSVKVKRLLDDVQSHLNETPDGQVIIHSELINGGIDVLEAGLKKRGLSYGKFIGKGNAGVNEKNRQQDVDDYNSGKKKIILISSAGGEGLDLPNTTMVASLDGHWNPEKINQVEARGIRMGGLSHRPEKDRKVIVNRYLTRLPVSNMDTLLQTKRLIDPVEMFSRYLNKEPVFYNPHKATPTSDQLMYAIAKSKAYGNSQLKDLFEKTSAYSFQSDKAILNSYLDKYQDKLLTGDYQDKWINEDDENRYIQKLRQYYSKANRKGNRVVQVKDSDDYENRTRASNFMNNFKNGFVAGGLLGSVYTGSALLPLGVNKSSLLLTALAGAGTGIAGGVFNGRLGDVPHTTTTPAAAKKKMALTDDQLRSLLRGESVRIDQVKSTDHFIKVK
jgi:superfamily II DNA/RNA helicase